MQFIYILLNVYNNYYKKILGHCSKVFDRIPNIEKQIFATHTQ